jgi:hypothetical protein
MSNIFSILLLMLVVYAIYGLILWGLISLLRRVKVSSKWAIFIVFLAFGASIGVWVALRGPQDSSVLFNFPGVLFGDAIYQWSIQQMGDPHSFQAHYTIPWLLRIPQVYVLVSIVIWGLFGLVVQQIYNVFDNKKSSRNRGIKGVRTKEESI